LITQRLDLEHSGRVDISPMHELATDREAPVTATSPPVLNQHEAPSPIRRVCTALRRAI
jgi:hypothetical protein